MPSTLSATDTFTRPMNGSQRHADLQGQPVAHAAPTAPAKRAVLPFEIVLEVVRVLQAQCLSGDAAAERALIAFAQTNKTMREWALDALYRVLILPRHVREFRKFYHRQRTSYQPFVCAGYTRALFCGLDDVSRLTAMTAGWESELMRLLHYAGPHLEYLSLWNAESRVILRDPIQVKGQRTAGALQPALQLDEPSLDDVDFPISQQPIRATGKQVARSDATEEDSDEDPLPNIADLPGWLRAEYERLPLREFYKRHKAHVAFRHKSSDILMVQQRRRGCRPRVLSMVISFPFYENEAESAFPRMTIWSRVEELDFHVPVTKDVAAVLKLTSLLHRSPLKRLRISSQHASIALALPPFKRTHGHEGNPSSNRNNIKLPNLASGLGRICASCVLFDLVLAEFQGHHAQRAELDRLQAVLEAAVLSSMEDDPARMGMLVPDAELWRLADAHLGGGGGGSSSTAQGLATSGPAVRAGSLASTLGAGLRLDNHADRSPDLGSTPPDEAGISALPPWARLPSYSSSDSLPNTATEHDAFPGTVERVRVRILQRGQDVHGKLRHRLQDFRERAQFRGPGTWAAMGVWDE